MGPYSVLHIYYRIMFHNKGGSLPLFAPCVIAALECGCLENPEGGTVDVTGTTYNSEAVYLCNTGFIMTGNRMRTCNESGSWSGTIPMCTGEAFMIITTIPHRDCTFCLPVANCGTLSHPESGMVVYNVTLYNAVATYICEPGFILIGDKERKCLHSNQWSGETPECTGKMFVTLSSTHMGYNRHA